MNPKVFTEEIITLLELDIELLKRTPVLDDFTRWEIQESMRYISESTKVVINCLKK